MSSEASPRTPNEWESDIDFSVYSLSSDLDLDFGFRGTTKPFATVDQKTRVSTEVVRAPESLLVLTAKSIALQFPFEVVESSPLNIPEELQRLIAFHSFPTDEDDICLYSCLSSGSSYEFDQGEAFWADKAVKECVQIGFHLSATVLTSLHFAPAFSGTYNVQAADRNSASAVIDPFHVSFVGNAPVEPIRHSGHPDADHPNPTDVSVVRPVVNIEPAYPAHRVSLTFDRGRITSCSCTCTFDSEDGCANLAPSRTFFEEEEEGGLNTSNSQAAPQNFSYHLMDIADPSRTRLDPRSTFSGFLTANLGHNGRRNQSNVRQPSYLSTQRSSQSLAAAPPQGQSNPAVHTSNSFFDKHSLNIPSDLAGLVGSNPAPPGTWCSHVVATCLLRIRQPDKVLLRAPISESLSKLTKEDLRKFAQNLICHVGPKKILPAAQRILDQLLDSADNPLKSCLGAPDPTAGGAIGDAAAWCFDGAVLEEKLRVTLKRFWSSNSSVIYSDIGSLNAEAPVDVENFQCVLHSLRGNDPRGVWDLLSIVGDMMRRQDNNGVLLLEIVTRCIIDIPELMHWWYSVQTKSSLSLKSLTVCQKQSRYAALWLCEEIVHLWRLACLNPDLRSHWSPSVSRFPSGSSSLSTQSPEIDGQPRPVAWLLHQLSRRLSAFHMYALQQACNTITANFDTGGVSVSAGNSTVSLGDKSVPKDYRKFVGFKPALTACYTRWPPDLPPTHAMSVEEFRTHLPTFIGARVATSETRSSDSPVLSTFVSWKHMSKPSNQQWPDELHLGTDSPDNHFVDSLIDLPYAQEEFELAFSRFQALDTHGHSKQALPWARYLAYRLLRQSPSFVANLEAVSFDIAERSYQVTESDSVIRSPHKKPGQPPVGSGLSPSSSLAETSGRSKKSGNGTVGNSSHAQDGLSPLDEELREEAIEWAKKTSHLLDQIRCLMECLTRSYQNTVPTSANATSVNRITSSGRSMLTFRGPVPALINLHLDNTASPIAQPAVRNNTIPIRDEWTRFDIELAFRLGFYGLSLPRPPTCSPTLEVRVFDEEVALVNQMCCLPVHIACPDVLQSIRSQATLLARSLSSYQTDLLVPYNLAVYLFHLLVGTHSLSWILDHLSDPSVLLTATTTHPTVPSVPAGDTAGDNPEGYQSTLACRWPVLTTGAILGGSGLPLAVTNHIVQSGPSSSSASAGVRSCDLSTLRETVVNDADLGFAVVLSVLSSVTRVPQSLYPYYVESQWAQRDALVIYLCRHYRDDIAKLDRILINLLDRQYNPHFTAPSLWACLSLSPRDLMRYDLADPLLDNRTAEHGRAVAKNNVTPNQDSTFLDSCIFTQRPDHMVDRSQARRTIKSVIHPESHCPPNVLLVSDPALIAQDEERPTGVNQVASKVSANSKNPGNGFIHKSDTSRSPPKSNKPGASLGAGDPASASEDTDALSDSKIWTTIFTRAALRDPRNRVYHSVGMAAVDTSAPETTSSDNSPSTCRRIFDQSSRVISTEARNSAEASSSALQTSLSLISSQTDARIIRTDLPDVHLPSRVPRKRALNTAPSSVLVSSSEDDDPIPSRRSLPVSSEVEGSGDDVYSERPICQQIPMTADCAGIVKPPESAVAVSRNEDASVAATLPHTASSDRNSGDIRLLNPLPNRLPPQPLSDSMAYHSFHLAKYVRKLAGGPSANESVFVAEPETNGTAVHRNLQLVGFQIGLYSLGLYNGLFPSSWHNRTYSRNGSWISQQVFELGIPAACILHHSWRQHLTPTELASVAFQLSRENDRALVDIAVELCLASLAYCATLRPEDVYRALGQCEEHSTSALERGLLKIEDSDSQTPYGILPEILFHLARSWFSLHRTTHERYKKVLDRMHEESLNISEQQQTVQSGQQLYTADPLSDVARPTVSCTANGNSSTVIALTTSSGEPAISVAVRTPEPSMFMCPDGNCYIPATSTCILPTDPKFSLIPSQYPLGSAPLVYYPAQPGTFSPLLSSYRFPAAVQQQQQQVFSPSQCSNVYNPQFQPRIPYTSHPAVHDPTYLYGMSAYPGLRPILPIMPQHSFGHPSFLSQSALFPQPPLVSFNSIPPSYLSQITMRPGALSGSPHAISIPASYNTLVQAQPSAVSCIEQPFYSTNTVLASSDDFLFAPSDAHPQSAVSGSSCTTYSFITPLSSAYRSTPTSNVSGSVVAHPSTSDHTLTVSETDLVRPATETEMVESNTVDGASGPQSIRQVDAELQSTDSSPMSLEGRSLMYLRRAYHCATRAVKKICLPLTANGPSTSQTGTSINTGDVGRSTQSGRGGKYHHSHQSRLKHSAMSAQSRANCTSDYCTSAAMNGTGQAPAIDARGPRVPITADPQMVNGWDANILWTLEVAKSLGPSVVHDYCNLVIQCVHSPLLVNQITIKVIDYFKSLAHSASDQSIAPYHPVHSSEYTQLSNTLTDSSGLPLPSTIADSHTILHAQQLNSMPYYLGPHATYFPPTNNLSTGTWSLLSGCPTRPQDSRHNFRPDFHTQYSSQPHALCVHPQNPLVNISASQSQCNPDPEQFAAIIAQCQQLSIHGAQTFLDRHANAGLQRHSVSDQYLLSATRQPSPQLASLLSAPNTPTSKSHTTPALQQHLNGRELIERLVNRTHSLFHKFIDQRLQFIGPGQTDWDEFVDLILKAYQVHLGMPATDSGLHWNNLLTRIRRHHKCSSALWQRILAGIQTADLKRITA